MWNMTVGQEGPRLRKGAAAVAGPVGRCGNRSAISEELVGERGVCGAIVQQLRHLPQADCRSRHSRGESRFESCRLARANNFLSSPFGFTGSAMLCGSAQRTTVFAHVKHNFVVIKSLLNSGPAPRKQVVHF